MQPLNLSLDVPISDSCSNCFCCFPFKKKEKSKTEKQTQELFKQCNDQVAKDQQDAESKLKNASKRSQSETSSF